MEKKAVIRGRSVKKVLLEISQISQESTSARVSFFSKVNFIVKRRLWHRCLAASGQTGIQFSLTLSSKKPLTSVPSLQSKPSY